MKVASQDESAANQGVEPATLQQALPQVHPQLQPFLGQMLAAAQMQAYGAMAQEQAHAVPHAHQQMQDPHQMAPKQAASIAVPGQQLQQ